MGMPSAVLIHKIRPRHLIALSVVAAVATFLTTGTASAAATAWGAYAPLSLYEGNWKVIPDGQSTVDRVHDQCARVGRFFACQQTVDSKPGPLLVFIPSAAGHYRTQVVLPDGAALGAPGTLRISGEHWVYLSGPNAKGNWYRTTNDFQGRDRIRFTVAHSTDGKHWIVTLAGVEERVR